MSTRRLGWATDIHLNFLEPDGLRAFLDSLREARLDGLLVSGDIAEAPSLGEYLDELERALEAPVWFVLGNHDYYRSSVADVRRLVRAQCAASRHLKWLGDGLVVPLSEDTALVGHDGWADARYGDFAGSMVQLSDFYLIADLAGLDREARLQQLRDLGDEAAESLRPALDRALDAFAHVVVLTHVPPFRESCWYRGKVSDDDYVPWFTCKAVGDVLLQALQRRPDRRVTVLCGHTHGGSSTQIAPNLLVKTGEAEYGAPKLQEVLLV